MYHGERNELRQTLWQLQLHDSRDKWFKLLFCWFSCIIGEYKTNPNPGAWGGSQVHRLVWLLVGWLQRCVSWVCCVTNMIYCCIMFQLHHTDCIKLFLHLERGKVNLYTLWSGLWRGGFWVYLMGASWVYCVTNIIHCCIVFQFNQRRLCQAVPLPRAWGS